MAALAKLAELEKQLAALQEENEGLRGTIDQLNSELHGTGYQRE